MIFERQFHLVGRFSRGGEYIGAARLSEFPNTTDIVPRSLGAGED
jgi:hypothetical protein